MSSGSAQSAARSLRVRRALLLTSLMLAAGAVVARAAQLQISEHDDWLAAAEDQHRERVELPARRGSIMDRNGIALAMSHEMFQVSVAPGELRDRQATRERLEKGLGITAAKAREATDPARRWVVLPGRYTADQRREVGSLRGVYFERQLERFYPQGEIGRELIGAVTRDGRVLGGIEQEMDEYLSGIEGYSILRRDARGEARAAMSLPVVPPEDGSNVYLTIDFDLQAIADAALNNAVEATGSEGGDLILLDPHNGDILAAVSKRQGRARSVAAITEPYEPGSTLKPFVAAALLAEHTVALNDSVFAENGTWTLGRRTFRDTSPHAWLSLRDALRVSSNIALVKFASRLSPGQQYSYLRDFGFGTLTGIDYPAESAGLLRDPHHWSALSSGSLAMGYELSVTPLQMAVAYGALANGGTVVQPSLVREVRASNGETVFRRDPKKLRKVVEEDVTRAITDVLVAVVDDGTATRASLATFDVAGKTGTSRRAGSGRYAPGAYISTFAGYFPANDPQLVIFVKLDEPKGDYYGGLTAAPVTKETLQAILAASNSGVVGQGMLATRFPDGLPALATGRVVETVPDTTPAVLVDLPLASIAAPKEVSVVIPDLTGLSMREAAYQAHVSGLRVQIRGSGRVASTEPAQGAAVASGAILTLRGGR